MSQRDSIEYPPGVRDLTEDISTDDLVRRLKDCAQAFQNMSQEEDNTAYIPLALYLASETFLEHRSPDVRLLVACCIADIFRVYAPEAPYKDVNQLKEIFEFFVDQLRGLSNPQHPSFKRYFYLLENLSCVKTFNICFEFEDNQKIICCLYRLIFKMICEQHNSKVRKFMLDMLTPLITEADLVPQELLDIIFYQIIEPAKSRNKVACVLAQDILKRTCSTLEPYIQHYFNNSLIIGRTISGVTRQLFDLIYELNIITPSMMVMVLPQLECKLKSGDEAERLQVTRAVAKMFSDNKSMMDQNKSLWLSFVYRFNDISPAIRLACVQHCKHFLLNHPESKEDITEQLGQRTRDSDEEIRLCATLTIVEVLGENVDCVSAILLDCVRDRMLDKKFRIRKEVVVGLAKVYKKYIGTPQATSLESISWIKNKVLHMYYQSAMEDKLLVERVIHTCFVPYQKPMEERMKLLYQLYCSLDEHATKAFKEILRCQRYLRSQMKILLENIHKDKNDSRMKIISSKLTSISKYLQEPLKNRPFLVKFGKELEENSKTSKMLSILLNKNITCTEAESKVKEILKCLGPPVQSNLYYATIKQLLERIAPVMIDKESVKFIVLFVKDSLIDSCAVESELGLQNSAQSGLDLLLLLSYTFPHTFQSEVVYNNLMLFLQTEYEFSSDATLQILINIVNDLERHYPKVCSNLIPLLEKFVETGSSKQAKHAVYCINNIITDKPNIFGKIIDNLKKHLTLQSQYFRTALVSIGHIAFLNSNMFATDLKAIITKIIHDLLMLDQDFPRGGTDLWGPFESLPDETKCKVDTYLENLELSVKRIFVLRRSERLSRQFSPPILSIEGMKVMIRWLIGLKDFIAPATSTLNLFTNILNKDGELGDRVRGSNMAPMEKSWMRSAASSCILKLCHEPNYAPLVNLDTFLVLSTVINDNCFEVSERFAKKLNKGLYFYKLPLEYLAMFPLAGFSNRKDFLETIKGHLKSNIHKRRACMKENAHLNENIHMIMPDYSLSYAVYLLAHSNVLTAYDNIEALKKVKECLKILLDALMIKNEHYSFPFFKRLLENIKQTKDIKSLPEVDDTEEIKKQKEEMNLKMYAVSDLALNIILSKPNHMLKEFPAEPSLDSRFFTDPDKSYSNMKTYLPPELLENVKVGFEIDIFDSTKYMNSISHGETTMNSTNNSPIPSTSHAESDEESVSEEPSTSSLPPPRVSQRSAPERTKRPIAETNNSESEASLPSKRQHSDNDAPNSTSKNSEVELNIENETSNSEIVSKDSGVSSASVVKTRTRGRPRGKASPKKNLPPPISLRSKRLSRTSSLTTPSSLSEKGLQNGVATSPSVSSDASSCISNFQHLLKECNVCLSKDEVENYTASKGEEREHRVAKGGEKEEATTDCSSVSSLDSKSVVSPKKRSTRSVKNFEVEKPPSSPVPTKRKREVSIPIRFIQNKTDGSSESMSSSSPISPTKSPIKNGKPARATRSVQKSKLLTNHSAPSKTNNSTTKGSKDSKTQSRVNNIRGQQTNSRQKKNAEVKATGRRR